MDRVPRLVIAHGVVKVLAVVWTGVPSMAVMMSPKSICPLAIWVPRIPAAAAGELG